MQRDTCLVLNKCLKNVLFFSVCPDAFSQLFSGKMRRHLVFVSCFLVVFFSPNLSIIRNHLAG